MKFASFLVQQTSLGDQFVIKFDVCACCPGGRATCQDGPIPEKAAPTNCCADAVRGSGLGEGALLPNGRQNCDKQRHSSSAQTSGEEPHILKPQPSAAQNSLTATQRCAPCKNSLKACHLRNKSQDVSVCSHPCLWKWLSYYTFPFTWTRSR